MPRQTDPSTPKKSKKGFMDGYKTYDTSEGFGSIDEWRDMWEDMTGEQAGVILGKQKSSPLSIFRLAALPATMNDLKTVYRQLMLKNHPDRGGTHEASVLITAAYTTLKEQIERRDKK
jgi:hypothetical protein